MLLGRTREKRRAGTENIPAIIALRLQCKLQMSCVKKSVHYTITLSKLCLLFFTGKASIPCKW